MIRLCAFLLVIMTTGFYQDIVPVPTKTNETKEKEKTVTSEDPKIASLIICDSQPNRFIVVDNAGKWVPTAKNVDVKIEFGSPATFTCLLYEGVYKPTNPQTKTFMLNQIKSMPVKEFQQLIDSLQTEPSLKKLSETTK